MILLHLGMVVYNLICVILMFVGVLGKEKEFRANWRKIKPSHKEPEHIASRRPDANSDATPGILALAPTPASAQQISSFCLLASKHQRVASKR